MKQAIIASAFKTHRSLDHNLLNHRIAGQVLSSLNVVFQPCQGSYKGETEQSYIVMIHNQDQLDAVANLFFVQYGQESILLVDYQDDRRADLVFNDGSSLHLGTFRETAPAVALNCDGYTIINGKYFVASEALPVWGSCSQETTDAAPAALHDQDKPQYNTDTRYADPTDAGHLAHEGRRS